MASLTLKNIPESLLESLRLLAARHRRSLLQETLFRLEVAARQALAPESTRVSELTTAYGSAFHDGPQGGVPGEAEEQLDVWRKLCGRWQTGSDGEDEVEAIFRARGGGREVDL